MRFLMRATMIFCAILAVHTAVRSNNFYNLYNQELVDVKDYMKQLQITPLSLKVRKNADSQEEIIRKGFVAIRPNAIGTMVICHGYTSSKWESFFFRTFFPHFNVVSFDFRAHGDLTDGQYSTIGYDEVWEVKSAVDFIKSHEELKNKPVIGFGFSMGAVTIMEAQAKWGLFDLLLLDSPYDSSDACMARGLDRLFTLKLFGRTYKIPGKTLVMKGLYSDRVAPVIKRLFKMVSGLDPYLVPTKFRPVKPIENAHKITVPCMFVICERDNKVSIEAIKSLYDTVNAPYKRMWISRGIKHCGSYLDYPEMYWYKLNKFLSKALQGTMKSKARIRDDRVIIEAL